MSEATNSQEVINDLVNRNLKLAYSWSIKHRPAHMGEDEAMDVALEALWRASRSHTPEKGAFSSWFFWYTRGVMSRMTAHSTRRKRNSGKRPISLPTYANGRDVGLPAPLLPDLTEARDMVSACLPRLPDAWQRVLRLYYWDGKDWSEVGRELGISRQRVMQIKKSALIRCRDILHTREQACAHRRIMKNDTLDCSDCN